MMPSFNNLKGQVAEVHYTFCGYLFYCIFLRFGHTNLAIYN